LIRPGKGCRPIDFSRLPSQPDSERGFAIAELANFYGRDSTVGEVLRRMRCSRACGGRVAAAWRGRAVLGYESAVYRGHDIERVLDSP
jgi:hypothetical protein